MTIGLFLFLVFQVINNIVRYFETIELALKQTGEQFALSTSIGGTVMACAGLYVVVKCTAGRKENKQLTEDDRILYVAGVLGKYFIFIVMVAVFIGFSTQTITLQ